MVMINKRFREPTISGLRLVGKIFSLPQSGKVKVLKFKTDNENWYYFVHPVNESEVIDKNKKPFWIVY